MTKQRTKQEMLDFVRDRIKGNRGAIALIQAAYGILDSLVDEIEIGDLSSDRASLVKDLFEEVEQEIANLGRFVSDTVMSVCVSVAHGDEEDEEDEDDV